MNNNHRWDTGLIDDDDDDWLPPEENQSPVATFLFLALFGLFLIVFLIGLTTIWKSIWG